MAARSVAMVDSVLHVRDDLPGIHAAAGRALHSRLARARRHPAPPLADAGLLDGESDRRVLRDHAHDDAGRLARRLGRGRADATTTALLDQCVRGLAANAIRMADAHRFSSRFLPRLARGLWRTRALQGQLTPTPWQTKVSAIAPFKSVEERPHKIQNILPVEA